MNTEIKRLWRDLAGRTLSTFAMYTVFFLIANALTSGLPWVYRIGAQSAFAVVFLYLASLSFITLWSKY